MLPATRRWELAQHRVTERRDVHHDTQRLRAKTMDEAVMGEAVDGLGEVGCLAYGFIMARSEAQLKGQINRADRHGSTRRGHVAGEVPRQEDGGRADQGSVDDLEVLVQDGEGRIGARWERLKVEALRGPRTFTWEIPRAIRELRSHEVPPEGRRSVVGPKSVARDSPACGAR